MLLRTNLLLFGEMFHFFSLFCEYSVRAHSCLADLVDNCDTISGSDGCDQSDESAQIVSDTCHGRVRWDDFICFLVLVSLVSLEKKMYKMVVGVFLCYLGCVTAEDNPNLNVVQASTRNAIESQFYLTFGWSDRSWGCLGDNTGIFLRLESSLARITRSNALHARMIKYESCMFVVLQTLFPSTINFVLEKRLARMHMQ